MDLYKLSTDIFSHDKIILMNANLLKQFIRTFAEASYSRSGGPGGQNINKVNTKVTLKLPLREITCLSEKEQERVKNLLCNRITNDGCLIITSDEERSQKINLERAYLRLEALISAAAKLPKYRRPTKPGKAVKERRLQEKRRQGQKKADRLAKKTDEND